MSRWVSILGIGVALVWGGAALAHEGHQHEADKVKGTVVQVHTAALSHIELKTTHGETVILTTDSTTTYIKGKTPAVLSDVKVGMRIVATVTVEGEVTKASEVQLGGMDSAGAHDDATPRDH